MCDRTAGLAENRPDLPLKAGEAEHEDHKVNRLPSSLAVLLLAAVLLATWAPLAAQGTATAPQEATERSTSARTPTRFRSLRSAPARSSAGSRRRMESRAVSCCRADRERLYVSDATMLHIETIDLAERRSIDTFTLGEGDEQFRIRSFAVDPQETYALILGKTRIKHLDRFEIGPSIIIRYDLRRHEVMDTIPWPGGHERERASFMFSPDGSLVYFSAEDMIVLESENFTEVDRWEISQELEPGLGQVRPSFTASYFEEPGFFTGLVRITDPINHRRMIGIARVDLAEKDMEFYTLGPNVPVGRFTLAPGGRQAWALYSEVGRYEFWAIDLEERRVTHREIIEGRPRMGLTASTNGELLYVHVAGNTIDIYDSETYEYFETVDVGGDMRGFILLPGPDAP